MSSRVGRPDTDADKQLATCLDEKTASSFIMVAGAGSGKTTSLVKALAHLERKKGSALRKQGKQVACITYTEVAVDEIRADVGDSTLFHVSTIHSFLWTIIHSYQHELRTWVRLRIEEKIAEAREHHGRPRTRAATKARLEKDIERYGRQIAELPKVTKFVYGTGSKYEEGVLGHDDILRLGPYLIANFPLIRSVIAKRFPFIFVDESQDTAPEIVAALRQVWEHPNSGICLGFFGDPMQKIYLAGVGPISPGDGWKTITKRENFRCPPAVLDVINQIRLQGDGLQQRRVPRDTSGTGDEERRGNAKLFIVLAGQDRNERLSDVRRWMSVNSEDSLWLSDRVADVRFLVIVHRMAARRLGFANLYSSINDNGSSLKDGLLDGSAWLFKPFLSYLLPMMVADREGSNFDVLSLLRRNCPLLAKDQLPRTKLSQCLAQLRVDLTALVEMTRAGSSSTMRDVFTFIRRTQIAVLDERIFPHLETAIPSVSDATAPNDEEETAIEKTIAAFLAVKAEELWGYYTYIIQQSPFATHQGIKGAEFERVLVVLDDEESQYRQFSYNKYLGIEPLSGTDRDNVIAGDETVVDRTRRLFYVCCSRALKDLAVVWFVTDVEAARRAIADKNLFPPTDIQVLSLQN